MSESRANDLGDVGPEPEALTRGRQQYGWRAWSEAYELLSQAQQQSELSASDLELLASAAYLVGRDAEYLNALEQAQLAHCKAGQLERALRCQFWLALRHLLRGEEAQSSGWLGRAQRLLERVSAASVEQGYLLLMLFEQHVEAGRCDMAFDAAEQAADIGERFDDADLVAMARHQQGRARLQQDHIEEGLALLDETMVMVLGGQLSPIVTGMMYCSVVRACQQVHALERVGEWTAKLWQWCQQQQQLVSFIGVCRVHRAEALERTGAWVDARDEVLNLREDPRCQDSKVVSAASYLLGDLHRLRGELGDADDAYRQACELGCEPQPGLALLRLAQGQAETAAAGIRRALQVTELPWFRAKLLPPFIEVMLAIADFVEARQACTELETLAKRFNSRALAAEAAQARGSLELAQGNPAEAVPPLLRAKQLWQDMQIPYALAKVRVSMARAQHALGDEEGGALELDAARSAFERLGAALDLRAVASLQKPPRSPALHGLTTRELEVLRLITAGATNKAIAARLFVSERTIDRHVANIFAKLSVSSRAAATACAYERKLI
ncbi:MAG TPA: LuxR C-terminal-related transcriptional regulator [Polyangiaceae bacterium]|nr:LuxR C-terminal-related transcriptional regulator [Polyangiaceae bacterium]